MRQPLSLCSPRSYQYELHHHNTNLAATGRRDSKIATGPVTGEAVLPIGTLVYLSTNKKDPKDTDHCCATDLWWTHKPYPILHCVRAGVARFVSHSLF